MGNLQHATIVAFERRLQHLEKEQAITRHKLDERTQELAVHEKEITALTSQIDQCNTELEIANAKIAEWNKLAVAIELMQERKACMYCTEILPAIRGRGKTHGHSTVIHIVQKAIINAVVF